MEEALCIHALALMRNFSHPRICWKGNTRTKHSRRFLESSDDNFLTQVTEKPTRSGTLLDLILTKHWLRT